MYIIGGKYKRSPLVVPKGDQVRPTTGQLRETVFNICQGTIQGASFLDLFAGSGAMGLEALSRGAAHATFVENRRTAIQAILHNISHLQVKDQTTLLRLDVLKGLPLLTKQGKKFDLIYSDPPYGALLSTPVLTYIDTHGLLTPGGSLLIEDTHLQPPPLQHLTLISQRAVGHATLFVYTTHVVKDALTSR
jgi:16S rRNA (guanine966-N2)-methyltransferase